MKNNIILLLSLLFLLSSCSQAKEISGAPDSPTSNTTDSVEKQKKETVQMSKTQYNPLNPEEQRVILHAGTERPGSGKYNNFYEKGTYLCRRCNAPLYTSKSKFKSGCGWPSFDDTVTNAVERRPDPDGQRIEIVCRNCKGHLGHVFFGEGFTEKMTRHCVNSVSVSFVPEGEKAPEKIAPRKVKTAVFASGCFWGTEFFLQKTKGVISTSCGYIGGHLENPSYQQVLKKNTGHYEAVQVTYDPDLVSYIELARIFFETHDPAQENGQGPDIGPQYRSAVFTSDPQEKKVIEAYFNLLRKKGVQPATVILPKAVFYDAETYHQDYYLKTRKTPYCHAYKKKFSAEELAEIRKLTP